MSGGSTIYANSKGAAGTVKVTATFTGDVYLDSVQRDGVCVMGNVTFTPCARTYWHRHDGGQVLRVLAGSGWICDKGGEPRMLKTGDTVYAAPGTVHWHGADDNSVMTHFAIGIGHTEWLDAVSDEDYNAKGK
ncbi:RmlC-like cupin domain-protein [Dipodascopsis tothii]|uniref:RmlC-like cupin domain-protein n=1 Tax=Dipodascopsis tothii TaxID=44089 RepID=UPI0034CDB92B